MKGAALPHPYSSGINGSNYGHMREPRVQHEGKPYRVFYAFDPRRKGYLILGGCKAGDGQFYDRMIPLVDKIYAQHLAELKAEEKT